MEEISAALAAMGIAASRIHTEPFGPAPAVAPGIAATPARTPHPPAGQPADGPTIQFARSNLVIPWSSAGANRFRFTGRVKRKPLRAERYRLRAVARGSAGAKSRPVVTGFRVLG